MKPRLLITGASGFIGSHAAKAAVEAGSFEVHTTSRRELTGARHHRANLLDPLERRRLIDSVRPAHLFHLAWFVAPGAYWTSSENESWAVASEELFEAFFRSGGRRLLGVGTSAEYDWSSGVLSEHRTPLASSTDYGRAKKRSFESAMEAASRHGASAVWARLFMVFGPGEPEDRFVPTMIRAFSEGGSARCDPADAERDFIHVADAADALLATLESSVEGAVNVGSGTPTPLRNVVSLLTEMLGGEGDIEVVDGTGEYPRVVADVTRLRDEVGFHAHYDLRSGLEQTVEAWKVK